MLKDLEKELHLCKICNKNATSELRDKEKDGVNGYVCNRCLHKISSFEAYRIEVMNGNDPSNVLIDYCDIDYLETEQLYAGLIDVLTHKGVFQDQQYDFLLLSAIKALKNMKFKDYVKENSK